MTRAIRAGRAFVELFADDSKLVRGLRRAEKKIKAFGQSIRNIGLKMAGLGMALLAPLLGAAKAFSSMGDQIAKMAKRTGLSVEALSELKFVASQTGTEFESLEMAFRKMQRSIYDAGRGLLAVVEVVWHALEVGWIETTAFFAKAWYGFVGFFSKTWERIKSGAKKAWNWIKSLFDDSIDLEAENKLVEQEKQKAISQIDDEQQRKTAEREAKRETERRRAAAVHEATMGEIGRENLRKHSELDAEYERRMTDNEADLAKARKEWRDAIEEARKKRKAKEAAGPDKLEGADDIIARANRAIAGMGDLLGRQAAKIGSQGTFVKSEDSRLQASDLRAHG